MTEWPDELRQPNPARVQAILADFWYLLAELPDLVERDEQLLAHEATSVLRTLVLEMMLALNGIAFPSATRHLNHYLGASQRAALEKTLLAPLADASAWVGQAVALVVIYRWYAPQLVDKLALTYPQAAEAAALAVLSRLATWPATITTS